MIACVIISMQSPYFLQGENFANIGTAVAVSGVMAAFTTIVLIGGGLDLSLGARARARRLGARGRARRRLHRLGGDPLRARRRRRLRARQRRC